jgi:hypothetical protein
MTDKEDTLRLLKRKPFVDVYTEWMEQADKPENMVKEMPELLAEVCPEFGWTFEEVMIEINRRRDECREIWLK